TLLNDFNSEDLRRIAESAATTAGSYLMENFPCDNDYSEKHDFHDVVTVHDVEADRIIIGELKSQAPASAFVGEEGGKVGSERLTWHIDPIDGTSNFATGLEFWCISIAAVFDETVVAGAIWVPTRGE